MCVLKVEHGVCYWVIGSLCLGGPLVLEWNPRFIIYMCYFELLLHNEVVGVSPHGPMLARGKMASWGAICGVLISVLLTFAPVKEGYICSCGLKATSAIAAHLNIALLIVNMSATGAHQWHLKHPTYSLHSYDMLVITTHDCTIMKENHMVNMHVYMGGALCKHTSIVSLQRDQEISQWYCTVPSHVRANLPAKTNSLQK